MEHQNNMESNQNMSSYHVRTNSKRFMFKLEAGNLVILIETTFWVKKWNNKHLQIYNPGQNIWNKIEKSSKTG